MSDKIELKHPFVNKCPDLQEFFKSDNEVGIIKTINALCYKIKILADKYQDIYDPDHFKGDALEMFVEYLVKTNASDNRIGVYEYKVIADTDTEDVGVDGIGIGDNGNPATVQVKFRSGDYVLTANNDHLSNFLTASWNDFQVPVENDKNMLIITTGLKVDEQSREKMLKNKVRVLNRDDLRHMLDNRPEWWLKFFESAVASRTVTEVVKPAPISLRDHQKEAIELIAQDKDASGAIILPTGCGKTIIEAEAIRLKIEELKTKGVVPLIKVNSSRILLCFQLFEEVFKYLASYGISCKYVNYNSGNADDKAYAIQMRKMGGIYREILSTTSVSEVKKEIEKAKKEGLPIVVFSTYHSSEKFGECGHVPNLTINDEAHNLVSREFHNVILMPSDSKLSFTATRKTTDSDLGEGMNNEAVFGNTIYCKSAKDMIDRGEMVPPWIHVVKGRGQKIDVEQVDADYEMLFESIKSSFFAHERKIKELSYNASEIGAKVLVVCRGQEDLIEMEKTVAWKNFRVEYPDVHVFALSSEFGMLNDDERSKPPVNNVKKFKMLKTLKSLKNSERCIIFHVDMIGEGIDVPGITGVMPFRNCELSKFVQNVGRAARLHKTDRATFYSGKIKVGEVGKWIKPYSWIIIPEFLTDSAGFAARFSDIIHKLRTEYGFIPSQNCVIDNVKGLSDEAEIDVDNLIDKRRKHTTSGITEFTHDFEEMSAMEQIIFDDKVDVEVQKAKEELRKLIEAVEPEVVKGEVESLIVEESEVVREDPVVTEETKVVIEPPAIVQTLTDNIFTLKTKEVSAQMRMDGDRFILLKGSQVRERVNPSCPECHIKARNELINAGKVKEWVVVEDIECNSSSNAASVVIGSNVCGNVTWKQNGKTLKEIVKNS
jgi:superfamily II DNA or RNA helicase